MAQPASSKTPKKRPKKTANAAPAYLGFSLQATRLLARLLQAQNGDKVCSEVFEDVGIEKADGRRIAEQNKSNLATNPLTDRAVAFWKTLRNWVDACRDGILDPDTTYFELYTSNCAPAGAIVQSLHDAGNIEAANDALRRAQQILEGPTDDGRHRDVAEGLKPQLAVVFGQDLGLAAKVVARFQMRIGMGNPHEELKLLLTAKLVSEDAYNDVVCWAHGWVKRQIDGLIQAKKPACISYADFHAALLNYVRTHDRLDILRSVAGVLTADQIEGELRFRVYIRQLQLVDIEYADLLAAANDYLRSVADRTDWADRGLIGEHSFEDLAEELALTWRNKKTRTGIIHVDKSAVVQGKLLFLDCMEHTAKLEGLDTPPHFVRGSWHALSEDRIIGWHSNYVDLLENAGSPDTE